MTLMIFFLEIDKLLYSYAKKEYILFRIIIVIQINMI